MSRFVAVGGLLAVICLAGCQIDTSPASDTGPVGPQDGVPSGDVAGDATQDPCPATPPGGACSVVQRCDYASECCCGKCTTTNWCTCDGTQWICSTIADVCPMDGCAAGPDAADVATDAQADAAQPDVNPNCPADVPISSGLECPAGTTCDYGQECCCGACHPSTVCQCSAGGGWSCYATDACMIANCPDVDQPDVWYPDVPPADVAFPDEPPTEVYATDVAIHDARPDSVQAVCPDAPTTGKAIPCTGMPDRCDYGEQCCCGQCYSATVCDCQSGWWVCEPADICMTPDCPDADVPPDAAQDAGRPDVAELPKGCCAADADCPNGAVCAGDTCEPLPEPGQCWTDAECVAATQTCVGASVCACPDDCFVADHPGTCSPVPNGCCWQDGDCAAGQVCRAQGGVGGYPGSCVADPKGPSCTGGAACCWDDADCAAGTCQGASACFCIELCAVCGRCAPDTMGTCG